MIKLNSTCYCSICKQKIKTLKTKFLFFVLSLPTCLFLLLKIHVSDDQKYQNRECSRSSCPQPVVCCFLALQYSFGKLGASCTCCSVPDGVLFPCLDLGCNGCFNSLLCIFFLSNFLGCFSWFLDWFLTSSRSSALLLCFLLTFLKGIKVTR